MFTVFVQYGWQHGVTEKSGANKGTPLYLTVNNLNQSQRQCTCQYCIDQVVSSISCRSCLKHYSKLTSKEVNCVLQYKAKLQKNYFTIVKVRVLTAN